MIFNSLNLFRLVLWPNRWSVWVGVPCALTKTVLQRIRLRFGGVFSDHLYWSFSLVLSVAEREILKSPTMIVALSVFPFIIFETLVIGFLAICDGHVFLMSLPFYYYEMSLLTFVLKPIARFYYSCCCFQVYLFPFIYFQLVSLYLNCIFCIQSVIGACIFIHSDSVCLLIGVLVINICLSDNKAPTYALFENRFGGGCLF